MALAKSSILHGFQHGAPLIPDPKYYMHLPKSDQVFTSITHDKLCLGCQGVKGTYTGISICSSAYKSVFTDLRDGKISFYKINLCQIKLTLLNETFKTRGSLVDVAPHIHTNHSVRVSWGGLNAIMLDHVQHDCFNTNEFLCKLLRKAKINQDVPHLEWQIFNTTNIGPMLWNQIQTSDYL
jgi:AMMECR1 domain-containing protein